MTGKKSNGSDANDGVPHSSVSVRINWVRLLKRVFDIDIEHCLHCGGTMKINAAILERAAMAKILGHLDFACPGTASITFTGL